MTVTHLPDESNPPRVAYAVGRQVGPAVVRNRVRRRLRAIIEDLAGPDGQLPAGPGAYLVSTRPAAAGLSYDELHTAVSTAMRRLAG